LDKYVLADVYEEFPDLASAFSDIFLGLFREVPFIGGNQVFMVVLKSSVELAVLD
jgi:hypothetical protein